MNIPNIYENKNYRYYVIVPVLLIIISVLFLIPRVPAGIDLKGGLLITVQTNDDVDVEALKAAVSGVVGTVPEVRTFESPAGKGVEIELPVDEKLEKAEAALARLHDLDVELTRQEIIASAANQDEKAAAEAQKKVVELRTKALEEARNVLSYSGSNAAVSDAHASVKVAEEAFSLAKTSYREKLISIIKASVNAKDYSFKEIGSSLSKFFFNKTQEIVVYAFILCAIIIFLVFRSLVPSLAVMFGAFADIVITAGVMGIFGIPWSLATVAALLMLIGFSLDTDVMLTVRVIKRKEDTPAQRAFNAMKTGVLMNLNVITAFGVLTILALWLKIPVYYHIGSVAVIGACADFIATWLGNAPMVLWYAERKMSK